MSNSISIRNKGIFAFVVGYHLLLLGLLPFAWSHFSWAALIFMVTTYLMGGFAITAGYHRLFSHRTYQAHPVWEWLTLIGSALAFQGSALVWSHDHRLHHSKVDTDDDPYSIKRGFWYAHFLWLFDYKHSFQPELVKDLLRNPRVVLQDRHYLLSSFAVNLVVVLIGCLFMHPLASFYFVFLVRMFAIHHCTWFINSLAHTWGAKTYARELSAVDNAVLALLTFGEGYHNYHHAFASDYRNGIRWYHFDPTKWMIWIGARLGLVKGLRTIDRIRLQRILVTKDKKMLIERLADELDELATELRVKLEELAQAYERNAALLVSRLNEFKRASKEKQRLLKAEIRRLRRQLRADWTAWITLTRIAVEHYELAHHH